MNNLLPQDTFGRITVKLLAGAALTVALASLLYLAGASLASMLGQVWHYLVALQLRNVANLGAGLLVALAIAALFTARRNNLAKKPLLPNTFSRWMMGIGIAVHVVLIFNSALVLLEGPWLEVVCRCVAYLVFVTSWQLAWCQFHKESAFAPSLLCFMSGAVAFMLVGLKEAHNEIPTDKAMAYMLFLVLCCATWLTGRIADVLWASAHNYAVPSVTSEQVPAAVDAA